MKPPWKYLTQLVSRRRPSEASDEAVAHSDHKVAKVELNSAQAIPLASPETTPVAEQASQNSAADVEIAGETASKVDTAKNALLPEAFDADKSETTADGKRSTSHLQTRVRAAEADVKPPVRRKAKPKTVTTDRMEIAGSSSVVDVREPVLPTTSSAENPFLDEAASLDDDIKRLKDQLAQKLRLQNAQLREMLERFQRG
jgi:hypothetical protein